MLPEVVVLEVVNHAQERISSAVDKMGSASGSLTKLSVPVDVSVPGTDELTTRFEDQIRGKVESAGGRIDAVPEVPHTDLIQRSARGRKPFSNPGKGSSEASDKGYRDTLIWLTILEAATADQVAFVTANSSDFSDGQNGLHPDLLDDLRERDLVGRVDLYLTLEDFLEANVPADEEALEAFRRRLGEDPEFGEALHERLDAIVGDYENWGSFIRVDFVGISGPAMRGEDSPEGIYIYAWDLLDIAPVNALAFDDVDGQGFIELDVAADVSAELLFHRADAEWIVERSSSVSIHDWSYNESMVAGDATVYVLCRLNVLFDLKSGEILDVEVDEVQDLPADHPSHPASARSSP